MSGATDLAAPEALELLASASVGRIVVTVADVVEIAPVTHTVIDGVVYFRTAPGDKLAALAVNAAVLFEADAVTDSLAWSVVVRGLARRLESEDEVEAVEARLRSPFARGRKDVVVRITPQSIVGRRFVASADDDGAEPGDEPPD